MLRSIVFVKSDVDEFLSEATRRLAASTVDFERVLANVARLAVPHFADMCTMHLLAFDDTITTLIHVVDEPGSPRVRSGDEAAPSRRLDDALGPGRVIATGQFELSNHIDSVAADGSVLSMREELCVPITAGEGSVSGAITFAHVHSGRRFTSQDMPVAEELGRRAGQALENARRFERERSAREGLMRLSALTAALAKPSLGVNAIARMTIEGSCRVLGAKSSFLHLCNGPGVAILVADEGTAPATSALARIDLASAHPLAQAIGEQATQWIPKGAGGIVAAPHVIAPLVGDDHEILGAITFVFDENRRFDATDRAFVDILTLHAAHALARANLVEREHRYHERIRLLADAGELLTGTLDYATTVANVTQLMMPSLADFCFFDVRLDDGSIQRIPGATEAHLLEHLRDLPWPPPCEGATGGKRPLNLWAMETGEAGYHADIDERWVASVAPRREDRERLERLRLRSLVTVPLVSAGERLGCLTVCYGPSGRNHSEGDLALIEELARRAAVALKNARLYEMSQETRRRAEKAARQAEDASRLKDEFLATVSHELRTPLSSILGWSTLLRGPRADGALTMKGLEVIERNARSQQRLIEDILDTSRIITGKLRIDTEPVDVQALANDILESVRPTAFAKNIELTFECDSTTPFRLAGDSVRLRQVLWNLLSNAVKFTPAGGRVWLELEQSGDRIVFRVRDTGRGIEPAFLPHVFERFRQADSSTTREHGGLGLGLAIVRHLTEMHGGGVEVHSDGKNTGATFTVTLPVRPFSAPIPQSPARDTRDDIPASSRLGGRRHRLQALRVLVVEDETDSRELIALLLGSEGAIVETASSAEAALALIDGFQPSVVLSDVGMPGRDGYWLAGELRRAHPSLTVLALTAYSTHDDVARAIAAGFDHHVAKPVDPELLVSALTAVRKSAAANDGSSPESARAS